MIDQLIIRLDSETKNKLGALSKSEGKTTSEVLRGLIDSYIKEHDIAGYIDDLWSRIGKKAQVKGFGPDKVQKAIRDARAARK